MFNKASQLPPTLPESQILPAPRNKSVHATQEQTNPPPNENSWCYKIRFAPLAVFIANQEQEMLHLQGNI